MRVNIFKSLSKYFPYSAASCERYLVSKTYEINEGDKHAESISSFPIAAIVSKELCSTRYREPAHIVQFRQQCSGYPVIICPADEKKMVFEPHRLYFPELPCCILE